ncbi:MAG: mechanosensitive ion channel family protein [Gemmatimonadetes bacterium]|jgi:small-conductance mechanosensitive channel|nr:mechanosensitive ion channel family protein [Gemmatimonadota bacterium]
MQKPIELYAQLKDFAIAHVPEAVVGALSAVATILVMLIAFKTVKRVMMVSLRRQRRTEAQIAQVTTMVKYAFMLTGIVMVVVSLSGSLAAMGLTVAFVGMILGWSLQRPVTGVAAWLMVMIKRPFVIGDRIIIQGVRGDVLDITPTHILLGEVGGTIGGEEASNRGILIPNAVLFDQMVTNYAVSQESKYILAEVNVRVSYDSDYELAIQTLEECAREPTAKIIEETGKQPLVRSEFFDSGIMMRLRYQTIATEREQISSDIVGLIVKAFGATDRLGFAYPHSAVEYRATDSKSLPPSFLPQS